MVKAEGNWYQKSILLTPGYTCNRSDTNIRRSCCSAATAGTAFSFLAFVADLLLGGVSSMMTSTKGQQHMLFREMVRLSVWRMWSMCISLKRRQTERFTLVVEEPEFR